MPSQPPPDADDPLLRSEPGFNPAATPLLQDAWLSLKRAPTFPEEYQRAAEYANRALRLPTCLGQRQLAFYLLGSAYLGDGAFVNGMCSVEAALDLAEERNDLPAQVELAYLLGATAHNAGSFGAAANYLTLALSKLDRVQEDVRLEDPALELRLRVGLGQCYFNLEEYERALDHLTLARALAPSPQFALQRATCDWITAIVWRWKDTPNLAFWYALQAAEAYERDTSRDAAYSSGRLQAFVAEIMLDVAKQYSADFPHHAHTAWVRMAQPYVQRALSRTHLAKDKMGEAIARLARIRWERLAGRQTNREAEIESLIRLGHQAHDTPLLAQAYTAMGNELAAQGHDDRALNCFRMTLDVVGPSEAPAMGHWARIELINGLPRN